MADSQHPSVPMRSPFAERLDALIDKWAPLLPAHLQQDFRTDTRAFGLEHDRTINTLEGIWKRRERRYAFDESTGLARSRPFRDHLAALLSAPQAPSRRAIGVLFIDLDKLKRINDTYGHDAGDRAVSAVGTIIRDAIRIDRREDFLYRADIDDDYSISRHGGDEFLVALELQEPSALDIVATRIKQRVGDTDEQRARGYMAPLPVSVSIGGVAYEVPEAPPSLAAQALGKALIAVADEQMYESKKDGYVHLATARFDGALEVDRRHARIVA